MMFKKSKRLFYITWLALGFTQFGQLWQLGDAAGAELLSQEPNENNSSEVSPAAPLPVRISRSFFEKQTGIQTDYITSSDNIAQTTPVIWPLTWNEIRNQTTPDSQAIATFDDHVGCAEIKELPPMRLCFNIQDDVSSLTLTSSQMSVDGLSSVADLSCISDTHFIGAKKNGNSSFTVSYRLSPTDNSRCKNAGGVLNLTVQTI